VIWYRIKLLLRLIQQALKNGTMQKKKDLGSVPPPTKFKTLLNAGRRWNYLTMNSSLKKVTKSSLGRESLENFKPKTSYLSAMYIRI